MAGLLGGILPTVYSQADRAKRYLGGLLSDPIGRIEQSAGQAQADLSKLGLLGEQAFSDPRNPMNMQDNAAARQLIDTYLSSVLNFAPIGMVSKGLPSWADELTGTGKTINPDGTITVYHRTSKEAADKIRSTGIMRGAEDGLFFSSQPTGAASGFGDEVLELNIPASRLQLDDIFNNEAHFRLPTKKAMQPVFVVDWMKK